MSTPTITPVNADAFMFPDEDAEPDRKASGADVKLCAEPGCMNESALTPTGRKGKYCEEHADSKNRSGAPTANTRTTRTGWKKAPEVLQALNATTAFIAAGVSVLNQADGATIAEGMPAVNSALVNLAKEDKKLQKYLEWMMQPGKYGPLILASAAVVLPIMANHGMLPSISALLNRSADTRKETD